MTPKVSILMNCFNGEKYLQQAIDSIYNQSYKNWEIIFIDNCSTDRSPSIAKRFDYRLRYFKTPKKMTLYAARNYGLQFIQGEFLAFLDTDDYWLSDKLALQTSYLIQNPSIYLIHGAYIKLNIHDNSKSIVKKPSRTITFNAQLKSYSINLQTVLIRYSDLESELKTFNSTLNLTGDYEFFLKIIHRHKAYYLNIPVAASRYHNQSLSKQLNKNWLDEHEKTAYSIKKSLRLTPSQEKLLFLARDKKLYFSLISKSQLKEARYLIAPYAFTNYKYLIFFFATFSQRLSEKIYQLKNKHP